MWRWRRCPHELRANASRHPRLRCAIACAALRSRARARARAVAQARCAACAARPAVCARAAHPSRALALWRCMQASEGRCSHDGARSAAILSTSLKLLHPPDLTPAHAPTLSPPVPVAHGMPPPPAPQSRRCDGEARPRQGLGRVFAEVAREEVVFLERGSTVALLGGGYERVAGWSCGALHCDSTRCSVRCPAVSRGSSSSRRTEGRTARHTEPAV